MSADLRRLLAEATPGPWMDAGDIESVTLTIASNPYPGDMPHDGWDVNAALIVAAVNALPDLLAVVDAARDLYPTLVSVQADRIYVTPDVANAIVRVYHTLDKLDAS
ncbi:MAG: hypothetical protein IMZ67_09210 [Acidobacteria bacterium]|nr:hypothetical protein [Acidobacteriota bacterium]